MNTIKLGNVSKLITKGTTPTTLGSDFVSEGVNFVKSESITDSKYLDSTIFEHITPETNKKMKRSQLKENDLLFSIAGAYLGKVGIVRNVDLPLNTNQAVGIVRLDTEKVNIDYAYYYFTQKSMNSYMNKLSAQSAQPNLNLEMLGNLPIYLPDLPTQKKIADVLSCIDDKIALNNKTNSELENMAKTVYDYWFTQFDFPDANGNPYKSSGGKMEYNQALKREIPAGWEVKSLDYFGEFKNGINYDPEEIGDTTVKIINVRNITESTVFFNISNFDVLTLKGKEIQKYLTDNNDIFIARSGTPGATRLLPPDVKGIVYCGFIIRYKIFDSVNKNYAFFSVKQYENQTTLQAAGTILKNVSQDTLKDIYIPVPEKEILLKFNKKIESIFNMQLKIAKENQELTKLRDYLLPLLMNGQISLN